MDGGLSQELGAYLKQYAREIISGGMWICAVVSLCAIVPVAYMLTGSLFVRLLFLVFGGACVFWLIRRLYIYYHRRLHGRPPDKSMFRRVALYALLSAGGILLTFGFFGLIVSLLPQHPFGVLIFSDIPRKRACERTLGKGCIHERYRNNLHK
jgi:hypothetical protein